MFKELDRNFTDLLFSDQEKCSKAMTVRSFIKRICIWYWPVAVVLNNLRLKARFILVI